MVIKKSGTGIKVKDGKKPLCKKAPLKENNLGKSYGLSSGSDGGRQPGGKKR